MSRDVPPADGRREVDRLMYALMSMNDEADREVALARIHSANDSLRRTYDELSRLSSEGDSAAEQHRAALEPAVSVLHDVDLNVARPEVTVENVIKVSDAGNTQQFFLRLKPVVGNHPHDPEMGIGRFRMARSWWILAFLIIATVVVFQTDQPGIVELAMVLLTMATACLSIKYANDMEKMESRQEVREIGLSRAKSWLGDEAIERMDAPGIHDFLWDIAGLDLSIERSQVPDNMRDVYDDLKQRAYDISSLYTTVPEYEARAQVYRARRGMTR